MPSVPPPELRTLPAAAPGRLPAGYLTRAVEPMQTRIKSLPTKPAHPLPGERSEPTSPRAHPKQMSFPKTVFGDPLNLWHRSHRTRRKTTWPEPATILRQPHVAERP